MYNKKEITLKGYLKKKMSRNYQIIKNGRLIYKILYLFRNTFKQVTEKKERKSAYPNLMSLQPST